MTTATQIGFSRIMVDLQAPVARITLNNPPLNVIDMEMMGELLAALEQIEAQRGDQHHCFRGIGARILKSAWRSRRTRPTKCATC